MTRTDYRLFAALALSLFLHLLPFLPRVDLGQKPPSTVAPMLAELRPPPAASATPPLTLPEPAKPAAAEQPAKARPAPKTGATGAKGPKTWTQVVREHLKKLDSAGLYYPAEAIAQGLQGDVDILLIIDENGRVSAARVEQGSGHAILDAAALRAVRSLQSLPADAPRQVVLPVRFRLR